MSLNSLSVNPNPCVYSSKLASALGKNTFVGVCSTKVRLMGLSSTSLALCVARHITPLSFPPVVGPILRNPREGGTGDTAQNSFNPEDNRRPMEHLTPQRNKIYV